MKSRKEERWGELEGRLDKGRGKKNVIKVRGARERGSKKSRRKLR